MAIWQLTTVSCAGRVGRAQRSWNNVVLALENSFVLATIVSRNCEKQEELRPMVGSMPTVVIAFRCAIRRQTILPQQREQVRTLQANSLTAKPTGAQRMCKVLSWQDSVPILQSTRLLHAWPF